MMEITPRQFGRIEAACNGLAKFSEKNEVAAVLVATIREQLDEIDFAPPAPCCAATVPTHPSDQSDMSDKSDMSDRPGGPRRCPGPVQTLFPPSLLLDEVRAFGRKLLANKAGVVPTIRAICASFGLMQMELAAMLGTSETTISTALRTGHVRNILHDKMTAFFGGEEVA